MKFSLFKILIAFLILTKFFHFNAPFFSDLYKKYYVLQKVSGEILGFSFIGVTGGGSEKLSSYDLLTIVFPKDVVLLENKTRLEFVFPQAINFISGRTFLRISYALDGVRKEEDEGFYQSPKLKELVTFLKDNPGEPIATEFFIYPGPYHTKYFSRSEAPEASASQILAFFCSAVLLSLSYYLLFFNPSQLGLFKGICLLFVFIICWTYGVKFLIYFIGFISLWVYYRLVFFVYTRYQTRPKIEVKS